MDMFDLHRETLVSKNAPLADRMRPRTLEEFVGQDHIIGQGRLLRRAIQIDQLSSLIFYGPPGTGKTTLARIIAATTRAQFLSINAVLAGIKEIRDAIDAAKECLSLYGKRTILFIDEVHRFNKAQQDALLPHVENGVLILIGATTENPYFEVNKALVSRSRIFQLRTLTHDDLAAIARMALSDKERGYGTRAVTIDNDAIDHLVLVANGDARGVLNALELAVETTKPDAGGAVRITRGIAEDSIQQKAVLYDKDGDAHYDTISAFIKSVRGSDPDAALYWMAKMVYAGEDPRFIFRRLLILACEDIGLADPHALSVVMDAARAFDYVGLPEGRYHLAHACLYLATAPKSNSSMAFFDALTQVSQETHDDVPSHLQDASRDKEGFGHGEGYLYPHAFRDHWVAQQYLPATLQGKVFFQPSDQGYEQHIKIRVTRLREAMVEAMAADTSEQDLFTGESAPLLQKDTSSKQQWMKRTQAGDTLGEVRDRIFTLAAVRRDSLILDLHCRTGFLTFEALRAACDGSVWSCAHDEQEYDTVLKMAQQYETLARPQVVRTSLQSFDRDIKKSAGEKVGFDAIIGRTILASEPDKPALIHRAGTLLSKSGCIVLAETVYSLGQRLSELVSPGPEGSDDVTALARAEEALFSDAFDPLVNWTPPSLEKQCADAGRYKLTFQMVTSMIRRHISPGLVDHWFRPVKKGERMSLGARCAVTMDKKQVERVRRLVHARLDNNDFPWKTVTAFLKITKASS
jgi:putative ATPase